MNFMTFRGSWLALRFGTTAIMFDPRSEMLPGYLCLGAHPHGDHGDDGADAHHDAQHREERPELVGLQVSKRQEHGLNEGHLTPPPFAVRAHTLNQTVPEEDCATCPRRDVPVVSDDDHVTPSLFKESMMSRMSAPVLESRLPVGSSARIRKEFTNAPGYGGPLLLAA